MDAKPILFKDEYDCFDDDVFGDLDNYEEEERKRNEEYFNSCLKKYDLTYEQVPAFFEEYNERVERLLERISCPCRHRIAVCNALCDYLDDHEPDEDDYFLWSLCLNDNSHLLFDAKSNSRFQQYEVLRWFFYLLDSIEDTRYIYVNQKKAADKFGDLISDISFSNEEVGKIDLPAVKTVIKKYNIDGICFESNLQNLTDRICHSKTLYTLAPLVYYAALMRYTKKMTDSQDYKMNFHNALRRMEYQINQNNGKNIDKFYEHVNLFYELSQTLCSNDEQKFLCYAGFSAISNICECSLMNWGYMSYLRPLELQLKDRVFTGFINGLKDNPCFIESTVSMSDIWRFEEYDNTLPRSRKILGKIRTFIYGNLEICNEYLELIRHSRTSECVPIVYKVINGSGIDLSGFDPRMYALVQAVVMEEIMDCMCYRTNYRLISFMNCFDKILFLSENKEDEYNGNETY